MTLGLPYTDNFGQFSNFEPECFCDNRFRTNSVNTIDFKTQKSIIEQFMKGGTIYEKQLKMVFNIGISSIKNPKFELKYPTSLVNNPIEYPIFIEAEFDLNLLMPSLPEYEFEGEIEEEEDIPPIIRYEDFNG